MTIADTGNGTYNITIPEDSAVKHFAAAYTVKDMMGNTLNYTRYLNVDPVPHLTNVQINNDTSHFVPVQI
jgi:hypothetical protein